MSLVAAVLVGVGGAVGAVARYLVGERLERREFPLAPLVVNVVGSFLFGLVIAAGAGEDAILVVAVGACGAFTTYSSFSFATVGLWERGERARAVLNAVGTLVCCLAAIHLAWVLVTLGGA